MFVNDLLAHINKALGQVHQIGWLNIIIFQVACSIARVQATVPLFASIFTAKHRPFDTSLAAKGGGRLSKNFLAGPHPNKVGSSRFNGQWFVVRGGIGPNVPIRWTVLHEVGSLFVRDSTLIKIQVQALREAIPVKPSWKAYCKEKVSATTSKKAKIEALNSITALSSSLTIRPTEVISLDDELTASAQEASSLHSSEWSPIEEGHLWNKRMEAFQAVHLLLSAQEGRKHVSSDPMEAFALSTVYMIKALNANYSYTRRELLKEAASEKTCNTLKADLERLKSDQSTLAKDIKDSRSAAVAATKRAEDAEVRATRAKARKASDAVVYGFVTRFLGDFPQLVSMYNQFKEAWRETYFEGLFVDCPHAETPIENIGAAMEGDEVLEEAADEVAEGAVGDVGAA
ncbi:hypothetical protein LIER_39183 [Lithospermum erythrorhizon]|uniref:Uncharacterized protein n=1 Tax=Lithospermum erythrorhizon TaxID=34254 RepID=A0AAV3QF49_LITER